MAIETDSKPAAQTAPASKSTRLAAKRADATRPEFVGRDDALAGVVETLDREPVVDGRAAGQQGLGDGVGHGLVLHRPHHIRPRVLGGDHAVGVAEQALPHPRGQIVHPMRVRDPCGNYWQTAFGPTNVMLHRISAALDLGDTADVVEHGPRIDPIDLPAERRVSHHIDVARAHSYLAQDDDAIEILLTAEQQAPQLVQHNPSVRETVRAIHRRAPVTTAGRESQVMGLAERCRAIQ